MVTWLALGKIALFLAALALGAVGATLYLGGMMRSDGDGGVRQGRGGCLTMALGLALAIAILVSSCSGS